MTANTLSPRPAAVVLAALLLLAAAGAVAGLVADGDPVDSAAGFVTGCSAALAVFAAVRLAWLVRARRDARDAATLDGLEPLGPTSRPSR